MARWAGQQTSLAELRRSPLATRRTVFSFEILGMGAEVIKIETLEKIGGELAEILRSKRT